PHVGCDTPHPVFAEVNHRVRPALAPERLKGEATLAGVSSFGFGGVNAHVVLERVGAARPLITIPAAPRPYDAELFVFAGGDGRELTDQLAALLQRSASMTLSELTDAASEAAYGLLKGGARAAIVASRGQELHDRLARAISAVSGGEDVC